MRLTRPVCHSALTRKVFEKETIESSKYLRDQLNYWLHHFSSSHPSRTDLWSCNQNINPIVFSSAEIDLSVILGAFWDAPNDGAPSRTSWIKTLYSPSTFISRLPSSLLLPESREAPIRVRVHASFRIKQIADLRDQRALTSGLYARYRLFIATRLLNFLTIPSHSHWWTRKCACVDGDHCIFWTMIAASLFLIPVQARRVYFIFSLFILLFYPSRSLSLPLIFCSLRISAFFFLLLLFFPYSAYRACVVWEKRGMTKDIPRGLLTSGEPAAGERCYVCVYTSSNLCVCRPRRRAPRSFKFPSRFLISSPPLPPSPSPIPMPICLFLQNSTE